MDAAILLFLIFTSLFCWLVAIADKRAPTLYRAMGVIFGVPVLIWYLFHVLGATQSPLWNNDIGGGWASLVALAFGGIAFLSRNRAAKGDSDAGEVVA